MGAYVVKLPDVGEGVAEAEIVAWHVAVGEVIEEDAVFVEVMTDKATVDLPSPVGGTVTRLGAEVGDVIPVGSELIWIEVDGAGNAPGRTAAHQPEKSSSPVPSPSPVPPAALRSPAVRPAAAAGTKPVAAPAVRKRAQELGIELADIAGSGQDGRIGHADLDAFIVNRDRTTAPAAARSLLPAEDQIELVKVVGLRRNIAKRMQEAYRRIPHFTYVEQVDVTEVERLRSQLNERDDQQPRLTQLSFLMQAVIVAVADHPEMNARFDDERGVVQRYSAVHLGIAAQTPKGLMVPVVKHAEALDLWGCAAEVTRLSQAARSGSVTLDELTGSTITITSLGSLGGIVSTPIINAPEVAIIGVNKIVQQPVYADGTWVPRQMMNLSSSFDHRVIDGWDAAQFIRRIRVLLETPALLFVD